MIGRALLLLLTLSILAACASSRDAQPPIRVMTFNIRLNIASDGPNAWPHRKAAVASIIRSHDVDVAGLQEALPDQLRDLDALLPEYARFGHGRDAARGGEHTAVLYRRDRLELLEESTFWLSETPDTPGSKGGTPRTNGSRRGAGCAIAVPGRLSSS